VLAGSRMSTLQTRIPDLPEERIRDLVHTLGDLRVVDASMFGGLVSGGAATDLRPR
jgi:hypothetical protein